MLQPVEKNEMRDHHMLPNLCRCIVMRQGAGANTSTDYGIVVDFSVPCQWPIMVRS